MDWCGYKVRESLEKGPVPCSQSIDSQNDGLAQAEKASNTSHPPLKLLK